MKRYIKSAITPFSDESLSTQRQIAARSNRAAELDNAIDSLLQSSTGGDPDTIWYIVNNPSTSAETLAKLADSPAVPVRLSLAQNPKTPVDILRKLSNDTSRKVLYSLVANPSTPDDVIEKLSFVVSELSADGKQLELYISFDCVLDTPLIRGGSLTYDTLISYIREIVDTALSKVHACTKYGHAYLEANSVGGPTANSDGTYTHTVWISFDIITSTDTYNPDGYLLNAEECRIVKSGILSGMAEAGYTVRSIEFDLD